MKIKEFYLENFPSDCNSDGLGMELSETATFAGLLNQLIVGGDVYEYIGVWDNLVRERLFDGLADELETSYDYVYNLWMKK
jgi:hypothetical protein